MKRRRAFLASAAAVAGGGCLGRITANPVYVLSAKTVKRTESAIVPEVRVVDEEVTEESPATVEISVYDRSLKVISVGATGPENSRRGTLLLYNPVSEDGQMGLDEREDVAQDYTATPPCWRTRSMIRAKQGLPLDPPVPPLLSRSETLAVGATTEANCLTPGSYHFEQQYEQEEEDVADVDWAFELLLSEPGV